MKLGGERSISQKEIVLVTGNGLYRNMLQGNKPALFAKNCNQGERVNSWYT